MRTLTLLTLVLLAPLAEANFGRTNCPSDFTYEFNGSLTGHIWHLEQAKTKFKALAKTEPNNPVIDYVEELIIIEQKLREYKYDYLKCNFFRSK